MPPGSTDLVVGNEGEVQAHAVSVIVLALVCVHRCAGVDVVIHELKTPHHARPKYEFERYWFSLMSFNRKNIVITIVTLIAVMLS